MPLINNSTLDATKHSLADHQKHRQAKKHNSDLANLALALEYVEAGKKALARKLKKLEALEQEIKEAASAVEAGEVLEYDEVHGLYQRARKDSPSL